MHASCSFSQSEYVRNKDTGELKQPLLRHFKMKAFARFINTFMLKNEHLVQLQSNVSMGQVHNVGS